MKNSLLMVLVLLTGCATHRIEISEDGKRVDVFGNFKIERTIEKPDGSTEDLMVDTTGKNSLDKATMLGTYCLDVLRNLFSGAVQTVGGVFVGD